MLHLNISMKRLKKEDETFVSKLNDKLSFSDLMELYSILNEKNKLILELNDSLNDKSNN